MLINFYDMMQVADFIQAFVVVWKGTPGSITHVYNI